MVLACPLKAPRTYWVPLPDIFKYNIIKKKKTNTDTNEKLSQNLKYMAGLSEGLNIIASTSKCHSDIKPENLLLKANPDNDAEKIPKISDFGVAKDLSQTKY